MAVRLPVEDEQIHSPSDLYTGWYHIRRVELFFARLRHRYGVSREEETRRRTQRMKRSSLDALLG